MCSEPSRETRCTKPVKKDKKERYIAASKNALALEEVIRSGLESLSDPLSRASVMALEGVVDNCITARSHIITIFADAQVSSRLFHSRIPVSLAAHFALQIAFGSMSDAELRAHMHDIWDALYVTPFHHRIFVTIFLGMCACAHHAPRKQRRWVASVHHWHFAAVVVSHAPAGCNRNAAVSAAKGASGVAASYHSRFMFRVFRFAHALQDIICDTKAELNLEGVRRWLQTSEKYCAIHGVMEEVD